jgi:hypothetical protein
MLEVDWPAEPPAVVMTLRHYFDSWNGLGAVIVGVERFGYDLDVTRQDRIGWLATFYETGRMHSFTRFTGSAFEPTIFRAVQKAARDALTLALRETKAADSEGRLDELRDEPL